MSHNSSSRPGSKSGDSVSSTDNQNVTLANRNKGRRVTASPDVLECEDMVQSTSKPTKLSKLALELESSDDDGDSIGSVDHKRKYDTENQVNGSSVVKNTRIRKKYVKYDSDDMMDSESEDEELRMASLASKKQKTKCYYDLQTSSDEEGSSDDEEDGMSMTKKKQSQKNRSRKSAKARHGRAGLGGGNENKNDGWLASLHDTAGKNDDLSTDSESELDDCDKKLESRWLTGDTRDEKLAYLETIKDDKDKALQMLLWDEGFGYNVHMHQFEAIRFVAGYVPSFPCRPTTKEDDTNTSGSDDSDGDDETLNEMLELDVFGESARLKALSQREFRRKEKGMLLADEMGLGKTIEALGGAILRNAAAKKSRKPTLIVTPQDGVMQQWQDALGTFVDPSRIIVLNEKKSETKQRGGTVRKTSKTVKSGEYILCTRYQLQSEMKRLFEYNTVAELQAYKKDSFLFPSVPAALIKKLKNQYHAEKGNEENRYINEDESRQDCVTRLIREETRLTHHFETVIIDESHFLRNSLAYWGMGATLLGAQSKRMVLLSGTPYNNSHLDMSAQMSFIDSSHASAKGKWWKNATSRSKKSIEAMKTWSSTFMLRREKEVIKHKLASRERLDINVFSRPSELTVYDAYEASLQNVLRQLNEGTDAPGIKTQRELMTIMMACMSCMRMALIHPILPDGREATVQFAPSRKHLLQSLERKDSCVLCCGKCPSQKADDHIAKIAGMKPEENDEEFQQILGIATLSGDDDVLDDEYEDLRTIKPTKKVDDKKGPIVELGSDICKAAGSACCHYAHESCIELFREKGCEDCPRCKDLESRIHFASSTNNTSSKVYCQEVETTVSDVNGFKASAKMEEAIKWIQNVPQSEKMIVMSFFKSSLDLVEGVLCEQGVKCIRYDGDISKEKRAKELKRFKTNQEVRVLLASVQSGGVGLNITEANHVLFLDRWFNPQVHDQAESRCHRIGQTKPVKVAYLDVSGTIDTVMKSINVLKMENAAVVLGGVKLGSKKGMSYTELAGIVGGMLQRIVSSRLSVISANALSGVADAPLFPRDSADSELQETLAARTTRKTAAVKKEGLTSSDDGEDDDGDDSEEDDENNHSSLNAKLLGNGGKKSRAKYESKTTSLSSIESELSDDESESDDDLLTAESIFTIRKKGAKASDMKNEAHVKTEAKSWKRVVSRSETKAKRSSLGGSNEVIELLSSDEEDTDDCEAKKLTQTKQHAFERLLDGNKKQPPTSSNLKSKHTDVPPIHELAEDEQLQADIRLSMEDIDGKQPIFDKERSPASMDMEDETKKADNDNDVARVQIIMPDGTRVVKEFVGKVNLIYAFVSQSNEDAKAGKAFVLKAGFPPRDLIAQRNEAVAGLNGEAIRVFWE